MCVGVTQKWSLLQKKEGGLQCNPPSQEWRAGLAAGVDAEGV